MIEFGIRLRMLVFLVRLADWILNFRARRHRSVVLCTSREFPAGSAGELTPESDLLFLGRLNHSPSGTKQGFTVPEGTVANVAVPPVKTTTGGT